MLLPQLLELLEGRAPRRRPPDPDSGFAAVGQPRLVQHVRDIDEHDDHIHVQPQPLDEVTCLPMVNGRRIGHDGGVQDLDPLGGEPSGQDAGEALREGHPYSLGERVAQQEQPRGIRPQRDFADPIVTEA